jgi:aspartyl-tRNA(Asn)/glutamyl-tRNA(Gln) amidotransferase subunit A
MTTDLAFATATELQAMLTAGEVSAEELARSVSDRLARHGATFNAVVERTDDRLFAAARRADARRRRGASGPLLGIPYGAKDIFATRGTPTRAGTAADLPAPDADATAVRRLDRAGAGLAAKLALVELVGYVTRRPWSSPQGPAISPWGASLWAGGSSGGSGAAVAAGLVPIALGSETAGSVGSPAAWCGITGIRPSYGLVGRGGMTPLSFSLDKPGVLARSAWDCADTLAVIAGADREDAGSRRGGLRAGAVDGVLHQGLRGLRMGVAESDIEVVAPAPVRASLREGVAALRSLGLREVDVCLPEDVDYRGTLDAIMLREGADAFRALVETGEIARVSDPETREAIANSAITPERYAAARSAQEALRDALRTTFRECDVLVTYNFVFPWPRPRIDEEFGFIPIEGGNTAMVWAGNLAGLPAVFLPLAPAEDELPVSLQVVGPPGADALVLAIGCALQAATDWHRAIPPNAPPA